MLNSKKDKYLTIKSNDTFNSLVENLSIKYLGKNNKTALVENAVKLYDRIGCLADKHTKGSIEVLLFKIEEMLEGK